MYRSDLLARQTVHSAFIFRVDSQFNKQRSTRKPRKTIPIIAVEARGRESGFSAREKFREQRREDGKGGETG